MSETEHRRARELLRTLSWHVEKMHRQRGHFPIYLWLAETSSDHREWYETGASPPSEVDDTTVLAALRAEMRADFAEDGVVRFAVAFPAYATTVLRADAASEKLREQVVCLEAHVGAVHLRAHREIHGRRLGALTAVEEAIGCFSDLC